MRGTLKLEFGLPEISKLTFRPDFEFLDCRGPANVLFYPIVVLFCAPASFRGLAESFFSQSAVSAKSTNEANEASPRPPAPLLGEYKL